MKQHFVIIGGGISGLSALHFLKKKFQDNIKITLLEKSPLPGGTIQTFKKNNLRFECGPNGFLGNQPATFELIRDLHLEGELISAGQGAKIRYICQNNRLYKFPTDPLSFLGFPLLSFSQKLRVLKEPFIQKGQDETETVYGFGTRRLGERSTQIFLDTMVSGIYAGDARRLNMKMAFPKIFQLEKDSGSLVRGLLSQRKTSRALPKEEQQKKSRLYSFKNGMAQLPAAIYEHYGAHIQTQCEVEAIQKKDRTFVIQTNKETFHAHCLIVSTPAEAASVLLKGIDLHLARLLADIHYAPVAVVGLVYPKKILAALSGFGYLNSSQDNKEVLGVLFEHNIFPDRGEPGDVVLRVMIGGARSPNILEHTKEEIIQLAKNEVQRVLGITASPIEVFYKNWSKAIAQYDQNYVPTIEKIKIILEQYPTLHLLANYLNGISMNDCVGNAKKLADMLS